MRKIILSLAVLILCTAHVASPSFPFSIEEDKVIVTIDDKVLNSSNLMKDAVLDYMNSITLNRTINAQIKKVVLYGTTIAIVLYTLSSVVFLFHK